MRPRLGAALLATIVTLGLAVVSTLVVAGCLRLGWWLAATFGGPAVVVAPAGLVLMAFVASQVYQAARGPLRRP